MQDKKQQLEPDMGDGLVQNWERSILRLLSPCLFNLYAEHIIRNPGLDEAQAGIKTAGRNINNFRYADDIILCQQVKWN